MAYWAVPPLFCLATYWWGLWAWYQQDDFLWLGQYHTVRSWPDLMHALFAPTAHGTFRPISERLPFLVSGWLFGANSFPFRLLVFVTCFANLILISFIARRLTGSAVAGFFAPILWMTNSAVAFVMAWSSAYMQILCGFCLLLAFHFFLRFEETGDLRQYWLQWIPFVAGFGVMETTIVYPALAASYALFRARRLLLATVPMFGASLLFLGLHMRYVPKAGSGHYALHVDTSILSTLATYWQWALTPWNLLQIKFWWPTWVVPVTVVLFTVVLGGYVFWSLRQLDVLPSFCMSAFVILLAPVLPLRSHISEYYLTLPSAALALLGAAALGHARRSHWAWKILAALLLALFIGLQWPTSRFTVRWWYARSKRVESFVRQAMSFKQEHPDKVLLLAGIDAPLYMGAIRDRALASLGLADPHLEPASARAQLLADHPDCTSHMLDPAVTRKLSDAGKLLVLEWRDERLTDITREYGKRLVSVVKWPRLIDVGSPWNADALGPTWHTIEGASRWMPKRATVQTGGPAKAGEALRIKGYCPPAQLREGALQVLVEVGGKLLGTVTLARAGDFEWVFDLPAEFVGRDSMEIAIEVERTFRDPPDVRELGLSFGVFEIFEMRGQPQRGGMPVSADRN